MKYFYLGLILSFISMAQAKEPHLKVLIGKSLKNVFVTGVDLKNKLFVQSKQKTYSGRKSLRFKCDRKKGSVVPKKPIKLASLSSLTGLLNWNKDKFKGQLHIISSQAKAGCDVVNELPLEDYLATLLPKEMSSSWPLEALKAQAVAARSYAYYKMKTKQVSQDAGFEAYYDIENSEKHQVNGTFFDATKSTYRATQETRGEVLTLFDGKVLPIFFHSKCGGKTLRPDQVWSNVVKGYESVNCPFCHKHGTKNWKRKISKPVLSEYLNKALFLKNQTYMESKNKLTMLKDTRLNSKLKFYQGDDFRVLKKSRLRASLGRTNLPSNNFFVKDRKTHIEVSGSGYGHGVGLCQFGAKELALKGFDYKQILNHYFPSFKLTRLYK